MAFHFRNKEVGEGGRTKPPRRPLPKGVGGERERERRENGPNTLIEELEEPLSAALGRSPSRPPAARPGRTQRPFFQAVLVEVVLKKVRFFSPLRNLILAFNEPRIFPSEKGLSLRRARDNDTARGHFLRK